MCPGQNDPEAPSGTEPAVEKDTLANAWTFLQGKICPLYSSVNTYYILEQLK